MDKPWWFVHMLSMSVELIVTWSELRLCEAA